MGVLSLKPGMKVKGQILGEDMSSERVNIRVITIEIPRQLDVWVWSSD